MNMIVLDGDAGWTDYGSHATIVSIDGVIYIAYDGDVDTRWTFTDVADALDYLYDYC